MKVISIGDLVTDFYYQDGKLIGVNGGMTAHNIIANLSKLGHATKVIGACGNDSAGKIAIKSLENIGVDISNIDIQNLNTRCFHISYFYKNNKLNFTSKKRCPICDQKKWYGESLINFKAALKVINSEDILVFDNLNIKNQEVIDNVSNNKMLDLGQYYELENYSDSEIIEKITNKFDIINLNERVEKYLINRFSKLKLEYIYEIFKPKLIIVTRGKNGADFVFDGKYIHQELKQISEELDSTGAGDAFFSLFISEFIENNYEVDERFITETFNKATKLTSKVVKKLGARGHINKLYKIKKDSKLCTCSQFEIKVRKKIKVCNININNLEIRVINALNSKAYEKLTNIDFNNINSCIFSGTGGSFAAANFSSKVINDIYECNTYAVYPRDIFYRNNNKLDKIFLFSYSGTTDDLLVGSSNIDNDKKIIITKGEIEKIKEKTNIKKSNIISYRAVNNKTRERGFLSFEGSVAPSSIFLKLYFEANNLDNIEDFIKNCMDYWNNYFNKYFKENKKILKDKLNIGKTFNIFTGDYTTTASIDFESKIIESGTFNILMHEKKNFSHGRFINYEYINERINIYFKQNNTSKYEEKLLDYLKDGFNIKIESRYNGILCEYDLLIASQYLTYYISNLLDLDLSKPKYSEDSMKLYFYKGEL